MISHNWWLYIAISVPLTALCLIFMGSYNVAVKWKAGKVTRILDAEEAAFSELKTG